MFRFRHPCLLLSCLSTGPQSRGDLIPQEYDYGFQWYQEEADRIRVEAHYLRGRLDLNDSTSFRFQLLHDAISGFSPTGALPGGVQPFTSELEDVRKGILAALEQQFGDHRVELEVSRSEEDDYLSCGIALSDQLELNQKNTTLSFGANYLNDRIEVPALGNRRKESFDLFTGISQLIDKNTVLSANFTMGFSNGYLNDPYKVVQRDELAMIAPGVVFPVVNIYRENRPDQRFRQVLQLEGRHYFESPRATLDATLRLSHDSYGILSETAQLEWRQEIGEKFLVTPFYRYYRQNAADFFVNSLNGVPVDTPEDDPKGSGPNYSADYRLSSFDAHSVGLRLRYQLTDSLAVSAAYERYLMNGVGDDSSPSAAYPRANLFTVGAQLKF